MSRIIVSTIQNRVGRIHDLPSHLRPAELGVTSDTQQAWIGLPHRAPFGIELRSSLTGTEAQAAISQLSFAMIVGCVAVEFRAPISETDLNRLRAHFHHTLSSPDPNSKLRWDQQILWDGGQVVLFGIRIREFGEHDPPWENLGDVVQLGIESMHPQFGTDIVQVHRLRDLFQPDWIDNRQLNFQSELGSQVLAIQISRLLNILTRTSSHSRGLLNTVSNLELAVFDLFDQTTVITSDRLMGNAANVLLPSTHDARNPYSPTGVKFDPLESNVIFADYSWRGGVHHAVGVLKIIMYGDIVTVMDDRVSSTSSIANNFALNADNVNGDLAITYDQPSQSLGDSELAIFFRRWAVGGDGVIGLPLDPPPTPPGPPARPPFSE